MKNRPMRSRMIVSSAAIVVLSFAAAAMPAQDAQASKGEFAALLTKAKAGDVESQWLVGQTYENRNDYAEAVVWLRKAAESGNVLAQDNLAYLYDQGSGVPQDEVQATFWMHKAAEQGDSWAQTSLGRLYSKGLGVPQNNKLAVFWWSKAAAQGDKDALRLLADSGDIAAQRQVGEDFESVAKYTQAALWLRKGAERGDPEAQYALASLYKGGLGVSENDELAVAWYRKAAGQGYADAQYQLGSCYSHGIGVQRDQEQAVFWLRKAADQGNSDAEFLLALLIEAGLGTTKDVAAAASLYERAAQQNNHFAQYDLGLHYEAGQGVPQDFGQAALWYSKAASQGDADAQNALAQLKSKLAAIKAEQKRRQERIATYSLYLVLLIAATFTAIRLHKRLLGYGKLFFPRSSRSRQLAVLLIAGSWCSACCLMQVLSKRAMLHPVNAAVTALLWAIPGLVFGAVCSWWLSHPLPENDPKPFPAQPEPARPPTESTVEHTGQVAKAQTLGYRWGKFQGWVILVFGVLGLLDGHPILLGNMYGRFGASLLIFTGVALIKQAKAGMVLIFICNGVLLAGFLWTFRFSISSFDFKLVSWVPLVLLGLLLAWWLIPAIFYYPKRWKDFSRFLR